MTTRLAFIIWIGFIWPAAARDATQRDYSIWDAIIGSYAATSATVYVWHTTEASSVYDRGEAERMLKHFPEVRLAREASNNTPVKLDPKRFHVETTVRILDEVALKRIIGRPPKPTWLLFPAAIENTRAIIRLSLPGYSQDGRTAYAFCAGSSKWKGSVGLWTIEKDRSGKWQARRAVMKDFTFWKDGNILNEQESD
jgi:hypothetical protein